MASLVPLVSPPRQFADDLSTRGSAVLRQARSLSPKRASGVPASTDIEDFRRDWRRWSVVERVCATLLAGLCAASTTTAMLFDAHLL